MARVLLVDDHVDSLYVIARLLTLEGMEVVAASSRREAMRLAGVERRCDVLVTDLGLPDGTGMDLLDDLARLYPIPAIALTAHCEVEFLEMTRSPRFARHLLKPILAADLIKAVQEVCESRQACSG